MIRKQLEKIRFRLRTASALQRGTRALFYVLLPVCGVLAVTRLLSWSVPSTLLLVVPALTLIVGFLSGWMRQRTIHECAVMVDRELDLDDRVATSLEAKGPFEKVLAGDTARFLHQKNLSPIGRVQWPRETFLLLLSLPLAAFLWISPSPEQGERKDPELVAIAQEEVDRLLSHREEVEALGLSSDVEEVFALLRDPTLENIEEAMRRIQALASKVEKRQAVLDLSPSEMDNLRHLSDSLSKGGAGLARALETRGVLSSTWEPLSSEIRERIVQSGLEGGRHASDRPSKIIVQEGILSGDLSAGEMRAKVTRGLTRRDWPERYDRAIRNYFSDDPQPSGSQRR